MTQHTYEIGYTLDGLPQTSTLQAPCAQAAIDELKRRANNNGQVAIVTGFRAIR